MKVVAFNGSPRIKGNTSILIDIVLNELSKQGIETKQINVGVKPVKGCVVCYKCVENKNKRCVIKSDLFNEHIKEIDSADGIILGSPVYCADVSGQMKNFIDRLCMVALANDLLIRKVGGSVVAVRRGGAMHTYHTLTSLFGLCQMINVGSSYWNFAFGRNIGEVLNDDEGLETMRDLGKNMAWVLKSLDYAKGKIKD